MLKKFQSLHYLTKSIVVCLLFLVVAMLAMIPLIVIGWGEIPFGGALGLAIFTLYLFLMRLTYNKKKSNAYDITFIALRYVTLIGIAVLLAFLYYKLNFHVFNVFAFLGGYIIGTIIFIIIGALERRE